MKNIAVTLYVICFALLKKASTGYPEHGISATTKQDKTYNAPSWQKVGGWAVSANEPGQYHSALSIIQENTVTVYKGGIYFVSVHILLANLTGEDISIAVVINDDIQNGMPFYGSARLQYGTDIDLVGFVELTANDIVSFYAYSTNIFKVCQNSLMSVRFHDYLLSVPGFLFTMPEAIVLHPGIQRSVVGPWTTKGLGTFTSSSLFVKNAFSYQIPVDGVYMMTANIVLVLLEKAGEVNVSLMCGTEAFGFSHVYLTPPSTITLNINEILKFEKGQSFHLEITTENLRVNILAASTFSVLLLAPNGAITNGMHVNVKQSYNATITKTEFTKVNSWHANENKTYQFTLFKSAALVEERSYSPSEPDYFYVTTHLILTRNTSGSDVGDLEIALLKDSSTIYMLTKVQTHLITSEANISFGQQTFSVALAGVFALTVTEPIAVGIRSNGEYILIDERSSFSIFQIISSYPGTHVCLNRITIKNSAEITAVKNWRSSGINGLYDFTHSFELANGTYTATQNGVYLVMASVVLENIDEAVKLYVAKDENSLNEAFKTRDGNPVQTMPLNLGGLRYLKKGDALSLYIQAENDEDWKILLGGLTITFISLNPTYFQAQLGNDVIVGSGEAKVTLEQWVELPPTNQLKKGVFTAPYTGTYFTIVSMDLDGADSSTFDSYYKVYIQLNGKAIKGLYSERTTSETTPPDNRRYYTLFFSGAFYSAKGSNITIAMESRSSSSYMISDVSQWGIVFIFSNPLESGALATLASDTNFRSKTPEWQQVGQWEYSAFYSDGTFEMINSISFEHPDHITVTKDGLFLISGNVKINYNLGNSVLFKVGIMINEETVIYNGMTQWMKSKYKSQTIHLAGTLYLKASDKIQVLISSSDFINTHVLSSSGLSLILIPEAPTPSSITVVVKNDLIIITSADNDKNVINELIYPSGLSSPSLDLKTGILTVPLEGSYLLTGSIYAVKDGENAKGFNVSVMVNDHLKNVYSVEFSNSSNVVVFSNTLALKALDKLKLMASSVFDISLIDGKYKQYLDKINASLPLNETLENPYTTLNFTIKGQESSFSLVYLPNLAESSSSLGVFTINRTFTNSLVDQVLFPWTLPHNTADDGAGTFSVEKNGVYSLETEINVKTSGTVVTISYVANGLKICSANIQCIAGCLETLRTSCLAYLQKSETVSLVITTRSSVEVLKDSKRVVEYLTHESMGFNVVTNNDSLAQLVENAWVVVGPWSANSTETKGLFFQNVSIYNNTTIIRMSGIYQITFNLHLRKMEPVLKEERAKRKKRSTSLESARSLEIAVFVNDKPSSNLRLVSELKENIVSKTFTLSGSVLLRKWDYISLKLRSSNIQVLQNSLFSALYLEPAPFSMVNDAGPKVYSLLSPSDYQTYIMGIKLVYECQAFSDSNVTYKWYKNGKLLFEDSMVTSILTINGYINDTGTYMCVAEADGLNATSNTVSLDILDRDECALGLDDCSPLAECFNTPGNYYCKCRPGLSGSGQNCTDADECVEFPNICLNNLCINKQPGFECQCKQGFYGLEPDKINCNDTNECEIDFPPYGHNCSKEHGLCTNLPGSYNCTCKSGWIGDGVNCTDENECETGNYICDPHSVCSNLNGSYECICEKGWFMGKDGKTCEDINDCELNVNLTTVPLGKCVENAICIHDPKQYPGSYGCKCAHGFQGNGTILCEDINECLDVHCNADADCFNTPGSHLCKCRVGWEGDGYQCADIDECKVEPSVCKNGNCTNKVGDYACQCYQGYRQNGRLCVVDGGQTAAQVDDCEVDPSSYKCLCTDSIKRENNILCNGLFVALLILGVVAVIVVFFVFKYIQKKKDMKIRPVRTHREKYVEMENESEL